MHLLTIFLLSVSGIVIGENCDKLGVLFYEDLGCTAISEGSECPKIFECHGFERSGQDCFFKGRSYGPGEFVDEKLSYSICKGGCHCGEHDNAFLCVVKSCPEWFGVSPLGLHCHRNYTVGACCGSGQICPESVDNMAMCEVDGKTYKEGQRFSSADSCHDCVCLKGWTGTPEKQFCSRKSCGTQLTQSEKIYQSCAPIYTKDTSIRCCPNDFYCPNGSETILGDTNSKQSCKFGDKVIKPGQFVERNNIRLSNGTVLTAIKCECTLPPLAACLEI